MNGIIPCGSNRIPPLKSNKCIWTGLICFIAFSWAGCATTSSGVNRQHIITKKATATLPFRVTIDEKGKEILSVGTAEKVNYKDLVVMFGVHSLTVGALAKNETAIALIRGKFAAGRAFDEAGMAISSHDPTAPVVLLELIHFKHFSSAQTPGYTGVSGVLQFKARLLMSDQVTVSTYAFAWETKDTFFPSQERDILREIVEVALDHWGHQILKINSIGIVPHHFPPSSSGDYSIGITKLAYDIFNNYSFK